MVNLPIVAVGLLCGFFLIPTSKDPAAPRLDPLGALLSIAGLSALLYAIIEAPAEGWGAPVIVGGYVVGVTLLGLFVWWERTTDHPMLDVGFFKNPRFTAASSGITLIFFAMFGSIFLLTQYLQFTLGYTPLEAGVRMLPFALTMMVVAPSSAKLVERIGTKITVGLGLLLMTLGLLLLTQLTTTSPYGSAILWRLVIMAIGMGLTMAPATDSVMGSLPLAKAGVGSAVNDTSRQVGGALGVAIIGSVLSSAYGAKVTDFFDARAGLVPPGQKAAFLAAREASKSQLGQAIAVAANLRKSGVAGAPQLADQLVHTANAAFMDGVHAGVVVAAAATLLGAIIALVWLPAHARREDALRQAAEFAAEHTRAEGITPHDVEPEPATVDLTGEEEPVVIPPGASAAEAT